MRQDSSITEIKGIGEKTKKLFEKMGVYTVGDILLHFPRNYIQYPHPVPIDEMTAEHMQTEVSSVDLLFLDRTLLIISERFFIVKHIRHNFASLMQNNAIYNEALLCVIKLL